MEKITDSRESILTRIHKGKPQGRPLPEIPHFDIPGIPLQNFISHLKGFDGCYHLAASREEGIAWILENVVNTNKGKHIFSSIPEIQPSMTPADFKKPADMHIIDICIAEATLGIGETGSLLVDTESLGSPAAALFSTDLYLIFDKHKLVAGLQDAYSQIDLAGSRYSAFFSGPSATADIEAVHITGAQGEISLTAIIYNCDESDITVVNEIEDRLPQGTPLGQPDAPILKLLRASDPTKGIDSV